MRIVVLFLCLAFTGACTGPADSDQPVLKVFAAASLRDALKEINESYLLKAGVRTELNLGGSNVLARQIESGAPADVFLSADAEKMDRLAAKGLIREESREDQLSNALVMIVPSDSQLKVGSLADLTGAGIRRIATGDPGSVPVGVYAKTCLEAAGLWKDVEPKVIATDSVRAALAAVESGNVDAGIVYRTDAAISGKVMEVYEFPVADGLRIVYPMAVLKESTQPELAFRYLESLDDPESKAIFAKHGFIVLPDADAAE